MKKLTAAMICIALFFLSACNGGIGRSAPAFPNELAYGANVTYGGLAIECEITQNTAGVCQITTRSPDDLKGLVYAWEGETFSMSYRNMEYAGDLPETSGASYAEVIFRVLETLKQQMETEPEFLQEENVWLYKGKCKYGNFELRQNPVSGEIRSIALSGLQFICEITE